MKKKLLDLALQKAKAKNTPESHPEWGAYHHFTFIIQNNKIVEWGINRTHRALQIHGFNPDRHKIHSEVNAIRKAKGLLNWERPFEAINIRLNKKNETRMSAPCKCCKSYLSMLGCKEVHYTTLDKWCKVKLI